MGRLRWPRFGPGLIAGASDNDPTTIATLAVVGSTTGYRLAWLVLLVLPMMVTVQVLSSTLGVVTRQSFESTIRRKFGRGWALVAMGLLVGVNLVTLAADAAGGADALGMLTGFSGRFFTAPLLLAVLALLLFGNYRATTRVLGYALLGFLVFVPAALLAHPDWGAVLAGTFVPSVDLRPATVAGALALLGTTLTAYVYFWQTIEDEEERPPLSSLSAARTDAAVGMAYTTAIFWFILVATGATLGVHGTVVQTAQQAAQALGPVAGRYAAACFAVGLLASALVALPVLAASTAYVVCEAFGWHASLGDRFGRSLGRRFRLVLVATVVAGWAIAQAPVGAIALLFVAGIIGGLGTPVSLALLLLLCHRRDVLGDHRPGPWLLAAGWATVAVVSLAGVTYVAQQLGWLPG